MFADKSVLDEHSANYIGMYDGRLMEPAVREYVEPCVAVVTIGAMLTDFNTGGFTAQLDPARTIAIGLHATTVGARVYANVEMADLLGELADNAWAHRESTVAPPSSLGPVVHFGDDPVTAEALYPRWAEFLREEDILVAETGTSCTGLAFAHLPRGARSHNQTL